MEEDSIDRVERLLIIFLDFFILRRRMVKSLREALEWPLPRRHNVRSAAKVVATFLIVTSSESNSTRVTTMLRYPTHQGLLSYP